MLPQILTGLEDMYTIGIDVSTITKKYLTVLLTTPLLETISDIVIRAKKLGPNWHGQ